MDGWAAAPPAVGDKKALLISVALGGIQDQRNSSTVVSLITSQSGLTNLVLIIKDRLASQWCKLKF